MTEQNFHEKHNLSEEQRILKHFVTRFFSGECPLEKVKELIEADQPCSRELWMKMAEQGYLGLLLPECSGGLASGLIELVIISEEIGKACLPGPFISNLWGSCAIDRASTATQRGGVLAEIVTGEAIFTVAFLQRKGGESPTPARLHAKPNGDGYLFNGESVHVMDGEHANRMLITAKDPDGQSVLALIPIDSPGIALMRVPGLDHMRPCYLVSCCDVPAGKDQLLAFGDRADSAMSYATSVATIAATAEMIGTMQWLLEAAMTFTRWRDEMGQVIEPFKDILPRCADALAAVEDCRSSLYSAATALQQADADSLKAVSLARKLTAETSIEIASLLLQRQEGMGFTWKHDLHMFRSVPPFFNSIS